VIKLLKQYPLIGMIVGALGISLVFCGIYREQVKGQIQLTTLQTEKMVDESTTDEEPIPEEEKEVKEQAEIISKELPPTELLTQPEMESSIKQVPIYICGEINNPGVYYVASNAIIDEVIRLSGGFTREADVKAVNLASQIIPNEKIIIPKQGEEIDKPIESYDNRMDNVVAVCDRDESLGVTPVQDTNGARKVQNSCININSADKETLMSLPGIGEVKANAIITYRQKHGGFSNKEELTNVSGIGEKTYEKLAQLITTN